MDRISIPDTNTMSRETMWRWYANIEAELGGDLLSTAEKKYMAEYYHEAGLLRWWRRPFFRRHFADSFREALDYLLGANAPGTIVDLGCGTGTQALLLAIGGAKVVGLDMDTMALGIFRKRKVFYEGLLGKPLDIEIIDRNVFDLDFSRFKPIRGIYSMFAFNMMQPSGRLLDQLSEQMVSGGRFVVIDGNSKSLLTRIWPGCRRNVWSPAEFAAELEARGIEIENHVGGVAFPPQLWRFLPYDMLAWLDRAICGNMFFPVSHQVFGEKAEDIPR